ncbi:MAG: dTDP-4-dehydrorhamnose 3,5-epimerase family protein [Vulcanimicrobiaceae bacterium]
MKLVPLALDGVYAVEFEPVRDGRGWFARLWDAELFEAAGLASRFVQQSAAWNAKAGTVRGLHFALPPASEAKIVRCVRGAAFDVVVDVRTGSPTFGRHLGLRLDDEARSAVYVPAGCAHGYQTLADQTELIYDISEPYRPTADGGIAHDDPALGIAWPLAVSAISARDAALPTLARFLDAASTQARS